jgi:hypothetical protein
MQGQADSWLIDVAALSSIGLAWYRAIETPPAPQGIPAVGVQNYPGGTLVTTSPIVIIAVALVVGAVALAVMK